MAKWLEPGHLWQRVAFALLAPAAAFAVAGWWNDALHGAVALVLSVLGFVTGVLSSRRVFRAWTAFGERLNRVVVTGIFGAIYFLVVPLFQLARLRDRLGVRHPERRETFWIERPRAEATLEDMTRM